MNNDFTLCRKKNKNILVIRDVTAVVLWHSQPCGVLDEGHARRGSYCHSWNQRVWWKGIAWCVTSFLVKFFLLFFWLLFLMNRRESEVAISKEQLDTAGWIICPKRSCACHFFFSSIKICACHRKPVEKQHLWVNFPRDGQGHEHSASGEFTESEQRELACLQHWTYNQKHQP